MLSLSCRKCPFTSTLGYRLLKTWDPASQEGSERLDDQFWVDLNQVALEKTNLPGQVCPPPFPLHWVASRWSLLIGNYREVSVPCENACWVNCCVSAQSYEVVCGQECGTSITLLHIFLSLFPSFSSKLLWACNFQIKYQHFNPYLKFCFLDDLG
jgi:hypothetical protein